MKQNLFILLILFPALAHAHHGSHGGSGSRTMFYQGTQVKPESRFWLNQEFLQLDEGIGQLHTAIIGGEWGVHSRMSLIGNLPIAYLDHNFRENQFGLGDLALGAKFLLIDRESFFALASTLFSFPTGDEDDGLGRGSVGQQIDVLGGIKISEWTVFLNPGVQFGYTSPTEPALNIILGVTTPKMWERLYFSLSIPTQIFIASDFLEDGSWKMFVEPQINCDLGKHWTLSLSGKVAIVDELRRQAGVNISQASSTLLSDVKWGLLAGISYTF